MTGIEPTTSWTTIRRSNRLSYIRHNYLLFVHVWFVPSSSYCNRLSDEMKYATIHSYGVPMRASYNG